MPLTSSTRMSLAVTVISAGLIFIAPHLISMKTQAVPPVELILDSLSHVPKLISVANLPISQTSWTNNLNDGRTDLRYHVVHIDNAVIICQKDQKSRKERLSQTRLRSSTRKQLSPNYRLDSITMKKASMTMSLLPLQ